MEAATPIVAPRSGWALPRLPGSRPARSRCGIVKKDSGRGCPASAAGYGSNLGALQSLAAPDAEQAALFLEMQQQQQQAAAQFSGGGVINVDGPAIAASLLVLLMLLALSFNRILGLERLLSKWLLALRERREYERRNEAIAARQQLEQQFSAAAGEEGGGREPGEDGGGGGGKGGRL